VFAHWQPFGAGGTKVAAASTKVAGGQEVLPLRVWMRERGARTSGA